MVCARLCSMNSQSGNFYHIVFSPMCTKQTRKCAESTEKIKRENLANFTDERPIVYRRATNVEHVWAHFAASLAYNLNVKSVRYVFRAGLRTVNGRVYGVVDLFVLQL